MKKSKTYHAQKFRIYVYFYFTLCFNLVLFKIILSHSLNGSKDCVCVFIIYLLEKKYFEKTALCEIDSKIILFSLYTDFQILLSF